MRVFVAYPSSHAGIAKELWHRLRASGHGGYFAEASGVSGIPGGGAFDAQRQAIEDLSQAPPLDVIHDVRHGLRFVYHVVDRHDGGMTELGGSPGLGLEACQLLGGGAVARSGRWVRAPRSQ